jgi:hypothetical protein
MVEGPVLRKRWFYGNKIYGYSGKGDPSLAITHYHRVYTIARRMIAAGGI